MKFETKKEKIQRLKQESAMLKSKDKTSLRGLQSQQETNLKKVILPVGFSKDKKKKKIQEDQKIKKKMKKK